MQIRRIAALLISIALLLSLFGCGNANERPADTSPEEQTTSSDKQTTAPASDKIDSNEFSKGTSEKSIQNITYQVPSSWREVAGENHITYFYPKGGNIPMMMVSFDEIDGKVSITDDGILSEFINGVQGSMEDFSLLEQSIQRTSSKIPCGYAEFSGTVNKTELNFMMAVFDCEGGIVSFSFGTPPDEEKDYTNDFYSVLNSIEVVQDLTQGDIGEYYVSIGDCSFTTDYNGEKTIVINYDFTNNSDETVTPLLELNKTAFQDGIELELAMVLNSSVYDAGIGQKKLRPGTTLTGCQIAYVLISDSPVEFEIGPMFGDPVLLKTYNVE